MKKLLLLLMLSCSIVAFDQAYAGSAKIFGKVLDVNGKSVAGVKVAVEGQKITATTSKDGSFKLEGVVPGNVHLHATATSKAYLDGETLKSISVKDATTVSGVTITLSGRPSASATYVGMKTCSGCHDAQSYVTPVETMASPDKKRKGKKKDWEKRLRKDRFEQIFLNASFSKTLPRSSNN